jgi:predicted RNA binding protein YcfA (HicA-like mRNA interferase family)
MNFRIETEQEDDGRWIAEVVDLPGVLVYASTLDEAILKAQSLGIADPRREDRQRCGTLASPYDFFPCSMTHWPSKKPRRVLASLLRIGCTVKRETAGSHKILSRPGWPDYVFAFHDSVEIGPRMLARIAKRFFAAPCSFKTTVFAKCKGSVPPATACSFPLTWNAKSAGNLSVEPFPPCNEVMRHRLPSAFSKLQD